MVEWAVAVLLILGASFLLLAAVGIARMPDLFSRMQTAAKAATLGAGCIVLAAALHFGDSGVTVRVLLVTAFLFLTAPIAAHVIARAAYFVGVPLWEGAIVDELRGRYNQATHELGRSPQAEEGQETHDGARESAAPSA